MKTRIFNLFWMLSASITPFFAQHSISGTVKSEQGEVLIGAKISLGGSQNVSFSDRDGNYALKCKDQTEIALICSFSGFEIDTQFVQLNLGDIKVDFFLKASVLNVEEVFVSATRANQNSAGAYTNLDKKQIQSGNFAQDIPYMLESSPSTVVTSDAGAGVGYTGIRIRGVDPSRTNVTINGIPLNDSESHAVYWVNMPDLASSVDNIQVQRGVGTSTNGAAAFGASINIQTDKINKNAYVDLDNTVGSFNTLKNSVKVGSGLLNNKFAFDMRLSRISSDGYIDRAASNLKSYFISGAYVGKKSMLRANIFSGQEITYQSWYGTPESVLKGNEADRIAYADRNYLTDAQRDNLLNAGRTYNFYQYDNEVDHYQQTHYQLLYTYNFNPRLKLNLAGHYTHGEGYYEQYRTDESLSDYNLSPVITGTDTTTSTDLIQRRWLNNDFYGAVFSVDYIGKKGLNVLFGGAVNQYQGGHYGEIVWARFASDSEIRDRYYDNMAHKTDVNAYLKTTYKIKHFICFLDLQIRNINYSFLGVEEIGGALIEGKQNVSYSFFNPKAGVVYNFNSKNSMYGSFSVAHREPVRDDFRESVADRRPTFETLNNLETGYRYSGSSFFANVNYFLMSYNNQLILTGQINDVGGYTRTNVASSYRSGIELEAGKQFGKKFSLSGNVTISQNKIAKFNEYVDDYDNGGQLVVEHKNTDLAFSPNVIASLGMNYEPLKGLKFNVLSKYVGKQYLDNTSNENSKLDAYYLTNISVNYTINPKFCKEIVLGVLVNNVFNSLYANNGYCWGYLYGGTRTIENFYYPQAGINCLGRVTLKF